MSPAEPSRLPLLRRWRYGLEHLALSTAAWLIPRLPLSIVRGAASILGTIAWAVDWRGRGTGTENLRLVMGDSLDPSERRRLLRRCYRRFARTFAEFFWTPRLNARAWDKWFVFQWDTPEARHHCETGGCVFATGHFGNFEWLSIGRALRAEPCMIIAQDFKNPPLTDLFRRLRSLDGIQTIIPQAGAMLRMFKHLKKGGCAAALVDLNVPPDQSATVVRLFGRLTSISVLHCALAQRTGRPIVPALPIPLPDGRWQLRFFAPITVAPDADYRSIAQRCWDVFEPVIREHPECWMWMYKHWRYLPPDAAPEDYPAYANRSKKFDRLVRSQGGL